MSFNIKLLQKNAHLKSRTIPNKTSLSEAAGHLERGKKISMNYANNSHLHTKYSIHSIYLYDRQRNIVKLCNIATTCFALAS